MSSACRPQINRLLSCVFKKGQSKIIRQYSPQFWHLVSIIIALIIALPILFIIVGLLGPVDDNWQHLKQTVLPDYIWNTLLLMLQVALYSSLIGVSCAWIISTTNFPGRAIFSWALLLPLATPPYIVAYVYTDLLDFGGPVQEFLRQAFGWQVGQYFFPTIRSMPGAALVISLALYPYIYLLARTAFSQRSSTLFSAARTLGASPSKAFFRIALPAARPAIIGGLALVLMETMADFGVVEYFGIPTFSTGIFRTWYAMGERAAALKLAGVMFLFVAVLIFLEKYSRKGRASLHARDYQHSLFELRGYRSVIAFCICATPVLLGCILPLVILTYLTWTTGDSLFGQAFWDLIKNSVSVATITTVITLCIALYFVLTQRLLNARLTTITITVATLGYALPGVMLAVGLLTPMSQFERWMADMFYEHLGWNTGLLLTGTTILLIYAYTIRFLTPAYNACESGLNSVPPIFDHVGRSLGATPLRLIKNIHVPLLHKSIYVAGILVFVDTMRELPATLMLRPFNFETLATRVYRLASDERLAEASAAALTIVIIGLVPILILNRLSSKES